MRMEQKSFLRLRIPGQKASLHSLGSISSSGYLNSMYQQTREFEIPNIISHV